MARFNLEEIEYEPSKAIVVYNDKPITGVIYENHPEGWLWSERYCVEGYYTGPSFGYFSNGKLREEAYMLFNGAHGLQREWNDKGQLIRVGYCLTAVRIFERTFDNNGKLIKEFILSEDSFNYELLKLKDIRVPTIDELRQLTDC
jgi:antitoxin component YwqK of YwqJK toxin-antitoxin module